MTSKATWPRRENILVNRTSVGYQQSGAGGQKEGVLILGGAMLNDSFLVKHSFMLPSFNRLNNVQFPLFPPFSIPSYLHWHRHLRIKLGKHPRSTEEQYSQPKERGSADMGDDILKQSCLSVLQVLPWGSSSHYTGSETLTHILCVFEQHT